MLKYFRHNDIVLNFYRSIAYRFDKNNIQHLKDSSRCKLATFEEIEIFKQIIDNPKYEGNTVKLIHMFPSNGSKWSKRKNFEFSIEVTDRIMSTFLVISEKIHSTDYDLIFSEMLRNYETSETERSKEQNETIKALRKENRELKGVVKQMRNLIKGL